MNKRFIPPRAETQPFFAHVITRVVDRAFVLIRKERDMMVKIIRKYGAFCGVRVLTYCVMSNHLHLLVEVPPKKKGAPVEMSDEVFLRKLKALYSREAYRDCELMLKGLREGAAKSDAGAAAFKAKVTRRMHDLSEFMKGVKQSFSRWFNKTHDRVGTLSESRFKSVIVQDGYALRMVAAYIDLNPVRAGMVERPEDYKWSSYGEAIRCRVRYLSDGLAVGSRDFVDGIFNESRELFGEKRRTGARVMREVGWKAKASRLYTLRQLRKNVLE